MNRPSVLLFALIAAADLSGHAIAVDGDTIIVAGQAVRLSGIDAPPLDAMCERNGQTIPCGLIAKGALLDLITALEVECDLLEVTIDGMPAALYRVGGFEVNDNMVNTGWALPAHGISAFDDIRDGAQEDQRGFWATDYVAESP